MKFVREMGPLAITVALFGGVIAVLLRDGNVLGTWLLAAFLVGHGWVHAMYVMPRPAPAVATAKGPAWPFELDHSWLLSPLGVPAPTLRLIGAVLAAGTIAGYGVAALATIPLVVPAAAWAALVVASTVASLGLMGLFFHRNLLIGFAIDAVLLAVALTSVWLPAV